MKRIIAYFIILCSFITLCSCTSTGNSTKNIEDKIQDIVNGNVELNKLEHAFPLKLLHFNNDDRDDLNFKYIFDNNIIEFKDDVTELGDNIYAKPIIHFTREKQKCNAKVNVYNSYFNKTYDVVYNIDDWTNNFYMENYCGFKNDSKHDTRITVDDKENKIRYFNYYQFSVADGDPISVVNQYYFDYNKFIMETDDYIVDCKNKIIRIKNSDLILEITNDNTEIFDGDLTGLHFIDSVYDLFDFIGEKYESPFTNIGYRTDDLFPKSDEGCKYFRFESNDDGYSIKKFDAGYGKYKYDSDNLVLPHYYRGNEINKINKGVFEYEFSDDYKFKKVIIPSYIRTIEDYAFYKQNELETVELNEGLENLGNYAFANCSKLEYVVIPKTLKEIHSNTFDKNVKIFLTSLDTTIGYGVENEILKPDEWHYVNNVPVKKYY